MIWSTVLLTFQSGFSYSSPLFSYGFEPEVSIGVQKQEIEEWARIVNSTHAPPVDIAAERIVSAIGHRLGKLDKEDRELGCSFNFPELGICYRRESITEDLIREMEQAEEDEKARMLEDIEKSRYFQQVSIFVKDYWKDER